MDGLNHNDISMETLQTFIVNAIKSITSEKRANELTIYEFVKMEFDLITNTDISNTLIVLSEMGRVKNKQSKDENSYFHIDNNIIDSQPLIQTIVATLLVEASSFNDILSLSVEDQIDSFFSSAIENDNNNSLETPDLIGNAYKYIKYKQIKDILLPEIKK